MSNENVAQSMVSLGEAMAMLGSRPALSRSTVGTPPRTRNNSVERGRVKVSDIKVPPIPPTPPKPDNITMSRIIEPLLRGEYIVPVGAIPRDVLDNRVTSKAQKSLAHFSTNQMTFSNFGKDGEAISILTGLSLNLFDSDEIQLYLDALYKSLDTIGSSGSLGGLLERIRIGMCDAPRKTLDLNQCKEWASLVLSYHDVKVDYTGLGIVEAFAEVQSEVMINFLSNAGVPYYKKVGEGDTLSNAVDIAALFLNAFSEGKFNELVVRKRPALLAVLLKNKQDYYPLARLGDKIRPYFVYPLHERLLYSCLQAKLKAVGFWEEPDNPRASSAVGFSWNYGGGDRLYDWIVHKVKQGPGFYPLFYGDDQLWVMVLNSGETYVATPDFSHMDLSLSRDFGKVAYRMWKGSFQLDKTWSSVLKLNCDRAFSRSVIVDGASTYHFQHGLGSGIPGTTKFDEVASGVVCGFIKEAYAMMVSAMNSAEDLSGFLKYVSAEVRDQFGLVFKDGTLSLYGFEEDRDSYDFEFLGQTLVRVPAHKSSHYVPRPKLEKILVSATTFKKNYKSAKLRTECAMFRMRALYAGGGYHYPVFASRAAQYWETMIKRRFVPISGDDPEYVSEVEGNKFYDIVFDGDDHSWPSWQWCINHFLPPDDQLPETSESFEGTSSAGDDAPNLPKVVHTYDLAGFDEEFSSSDDEIPPPEESSLVVESAPGGVDIPSSSAKSPDNEGRTPVFSGGVSAEDQQKIDAAFNSKSWATAMAREREPEQDVGGNPPPPPKVIRPDQVGRLLPLSEAQKAAFRQAQEEKRQLARDEKARKRAAWEQSKAGSRFMASKAGRRGDSRRAGASIEVGDFDYQSHDTADEDDE